MRDRFESPMTPRHRDLLTVVETMNCGLSASDPQGVVVYANPRLLAWLRYEWDDVVGHPAMNLAVPEHADMLRAEAQAMREGDLRVRLVVLRRKDSTTFPALMIPHLFYDEDGNFEGTFSITVDLGAVQTAKRIGIADDPFDVGSRLDEIARQLAALTSRATHPEGPIDRRHPALADLSPREIETLEHLLVGERVSTIATNMFISEHTVRSHLKSIFRKTGTSSQAKLVSWARALP